MAFEWISTSSRFRNSSDIFVNSRETTAAIIGEIVVFLQFKEFKLYWSKKEWFFCVKFFPCKFKVE